MIRKVRIEHFLHLFPLLIPGRALFAVPQLFSQFQLPTDVDSVVWARLCEVYAFQETSQGGSPFRPTEPQLLGAYRHINETWAFVLDPKSCTCQPDCAACAGTLPGSRIVGMSPKCLVEKGYNPASVCKHKIVGVSGGAIVFPFNTTKVKPLVDGQPPLCFQYATITGTLVRSFEAMMVSHPEWQGSFSLPIT
jgi:hypothetical protein